MINPKYLVLLGVICLSAVLGLSIQRPDHIWGGDFALYVEQAQSLWEGTVQDLWEDTSFSVDESAAHPFSPKLYPWGLPFLLAPVVKVAGLNYGILKIYQLALFLGTLVICFYWLKQHFSETEALVLTSVWALHPVFIMYNNFIISDIPYAGALLLAVWCINRCYLGKETSRLHWGWWIGCGAALWLALMIRQEGKVLLASLALVHAVKILRSSGSPIEYLRTHWKELVPYGVAVGGMIILNLLLPTGTASNIRQVRPEDITLLGNLQHYLGLFERLMGAWFSGTLYLLTGALVIWGVVSRFSKDTLYISYCFLHLAVLVVWPYTAGVRFIFPLFPFYLYFCYRGLKSVAGLWLNSSKTRMVAASFMGGWAVLLLVQMTLVAADIDHSRVMDGPEHPASREMFTFISEQTRPEDIIIFFKPRVLHLYTGRKSFNMDKPEGMWKGDYYVMHKNKGDYDQVPVYRYPDSEFEFLHQIFENEMFLVFKIDNKSIMPVRQEGVMQE